MMNLAVLKGVISRKNRAAGIAKNMLHAFPFQALPKNAGPGHHLASSWRAFRIGHNFPPSAIPSEAAGLTMSLHPKKNKAHPASISGGWDSGAVKISNFSAHSSLRTRTDRHTRTPGILQLIRRNLRPLITVSPEIEAHYNKPTGRSASYSPGPSG